MPHPRGAAPAVQLDAGGGAAVHAVPRRLSWSLSMRPGLQFLFPATECVPPSSMRNCVGRAAPGSNVFDWRLRQICIKLIRLLPGTRVPRKQKFGAVAQLVAHLHGMQGVRGSSPLSSTKNKKTTRRVVFLFPRSWLGSRRSTSGPVGITSSRNQVQSERRSGGSAPPGLCTRTWLTPVIPASKPRALDAM